MLIINFKDYSTKYRCWGDSEFRGKDSAFFVKVVKSCILWSVMCKKKNIKQPFNAPILIIECGLKNHFLKMISFILREPNLLLTVLLCNRGAEPDVVSLFERVNGPVNEPEMVFP